MKKIITPRVIVYSFILVALISILSFAVATRSDVETTVLKVPGTLYQREGKFITNLYNVEFVNKTFADLPLEVKVESPQSAQLIKVDGKAIVVPGEGMIKSVYFIKIPEGHVNTAKTVVTLGVYHKGKRLEKVKAKFIGPVSSGPLQKVKK